MYNPVTPQAAVVVNGYLDLQDLSRRDASSGDIYTGGAASQDEKFSVMMHDLVFRNPSNNRTKRVVDKTCGKPRLNVYSSFSDKKKIDQKMSTPWYSADVPVFVGLSLTTMPYSDAKSRRSSQVAIRVAGSDTIINTAWIYCYGIFIRHMSKDAQKPEDNARPSAPGGVARAFTPAESARVDQMLRLQRGLIYLEQHLIQVDPDALRANNVIPGLFHTEKRP
ncbi:hypothetical protein CYMTET_38371 [Cymbomonas tetramitiformis]|uniref:Uncharacterized protein n=1 Tax=Cymbomonas tetramitiformis TaxID=36881 RepID=A0AAE0F5S0_9CHLO|nr:hypothetical protein CYMTET_38371 [Cymbomonas tetramitiformis]